MRPVDGTHSEENLTRCTSQDSNVSNADCSDETAFAKCGPWQSVANIRSGFTFEENEAYFSTTTDSNGQSNSTFTNYSIKSNTAAIQRNHTQIPGPRTAR